MTTCRTRSSGSASTSADSNEATAAAASPLRPHRKRKPSADADGASATSQVRSKPRPVSHPLSQALVSFAVAAWDDDDSDSIYGGGGSDDDGEASSDVAKVAAVSVRVFPDLPPRFALAIWSCFLDIAKACIQRYNAEHQDDVVFVVHKRTHALGCGLLVLGEPDGSDYYHLNFHAHDKKQKHRRHSPSSSQLFFAEIRVAVEPKEEDVTCCCPVSHSDAGGKRVETCADALKYKFPAWGTAGMDRECCYGCPKAIKHPDGASYVAGHVADARHYFVPNK